MREKLAIHGGKPVRKAMLPYGRHWLDESDITAVVEALGSDWLTTGPKVAQFEEVFAQSVGVKEAVAVSSGTAALHAALYALGIGPGDEVLVPTITFVASANSVVFLGAKPVFVDVDADTLLLDLEQVESNITPRTKAIIPVDYAGQPCDYDELHIISHKHNLTVLADACHSLGGAYKGRQVGGLGNLNVFSLHPVKHATTGEGGIITANDSVLAQRMRVFRNHGITSDHRVREAQGSWFYEMVDLGYNYRLTDFQCALGISQLGRLPDWIRRRQEIARKYDAAFTSLCAVKPLDCRPGISHAYHLYVIRLDLTRLAAGRGEVFAALRAEGIGVNVHYIPVHLQPFYRRRFGTGPGLCPVAERIYEQILSLPIFPLMTDEDTESVILAVNKVVGAYAK